MSDNFLEKAKGPIATETVITLTEDGKVVSRWGKNL